MRYVIVSPPYEPSSAGVKVLYELQKHLIRIGEDAIVINLPCRMEEEDVLVIPECMHRKDFDANYVVRYYLNRPIEGMDYKDDEFKLVYNDNDLDGKEDAKLREYLIEPFFHNYGYKERLYKAYYIGKGKYEDLPEIKECVQITRNWPPTRKNMADFLNRCHTLYTFDDKTVLVTEAEQCGCKTVLVKNGEFRTDHKIREAETETFQKQLYNFNKKVKEMVHEKNVRR